MKSKFSERIAETMHAAGLTVGSLANDLRTHPSTVSRWLNGSVPRGRMLEDLAEALGVPLVWLRDGREEAKPEPGESAAPATQTQTQNGALYSRIGDDELFLGLLDCAKRVQAEKNNVVALSLLEACASIIEELRLRIEATFEKKPSNRQP